MTERTRRASRRREPLSRERVLRAAVDLADEGGIEALSMRRLGAALDVEAMSLYNHVSSKDDLLDGIVEVVAEELETGPGDIDWRETLRRYAVSSRAMLLRHPWAAALVESRTQSGPARLRYMESTLSALRRDGFTIEGAYRAILTLDSFIYGFTLQEVAWPATSNETPDMAAAFVERTPVDEYPHLVEVASLTAELGLDRTVDFEFGLNLVLEGLERALRPLSPEALSD